MSRGAWPTESNPPEMPQPSRITSFTRLGTELSLRGAAHLLPLHLSLLGQQRGSQGKPRTQILHVITSWAPILESFQQPQQNTKHTSAHQYRLRSFWPPDFKTTMRSISLLHRLNAAFKRRGWSQPSPAGWEYSSSPHAPCPAPWRRWRSG